MEKRYTTPNRGNALPHYSVLLSPLHKGSSEKQKDEKIWNFKVSIFPSKRSKGMLYSMNLQSGTDSIRGVKEMNNIEQDGPFLGQELR